MGPFPRNMQAYSIVGTLALLLPVVLAGSSAAMMKQCKPELDACEANVNCKAMLNCVSFECLDLRAHTAPGDCIKRAQALSAKLGEAYSPMICDKSCYDDYGYGNDQWIAFSACGKRASSACLNRLRCNRSR